MLKVEELIELIASKALINGVGEFFYGTTRMPSQTEAS
jgi:hypothetical protein